MLTEAVFTRGRAVTADSVTAASPRAVTQSTNEITKLVHAISLHVQSREDSKNKAAFCYTLRQIYLLWLN